jgi:voltage-gated potassium channel Kch
MLPIALLGLAAVIATILVHALGTAWWLQRLRARNRVELRRVLSVLVKTSLVLISLHVTEVFVWSLVFRLLPRGGLTSLEEAMYLSFTTFTTLGYGDVTLQGPSRMLTGIEALNGVLLIGWSTALSFAVIRRVWERTERPRRSS